MPALRPIAFLLGQLVLVLGGLMLLPLGVDLATRPQEAAAFAFAAAITISAGLFTLLAARSGQRPVLTRKDTILLTVLLWVILPLFAAIPFWAGATEARFVDGAFEALSALTTTGASVFSGLEQLPQGLLLWRGMLQWIGGIGVIVMAMLFMPVLRLGGAQVVRPETGDVGGSLMPRAVDVARGIASVYIALTLACGLAYAAAGLSGFDALVHAMTTVSTGGMANYDRSFAEFGGQAQSVAILFMILGTLPFYRFVQMSQGQTKALWRDSQVRSYLVYLAVVLVLMLLWVALQEGRFDLDLLRSVVFSVVSIASGTGLASLDYSAWGPFALALLFCVGLVGGCGGSTSCAIKIYRLQITFAVIANEIRRARHPRGLFALRYAGQPVAPGLVTAILVFVGLFGASLAVSALALSLCGMEFLTAVSAAAAMLANLGPGLTAEIGPVGSYAGQSDAAKWVLMATMGVGRLEILAVLVVLSRAFWRA